MRVENSILIISAASTPDPELNQVIIEKGYIARNLAFDTVTENRLPKQKPVCLVISVNQYDVEYAAIIERIQVNYPGYDIPV